MATVAKNWDMWMDKSWIEEMQQVGEGIEKKATDVLGVRGTVS